MRHNHKNKITVTALAAVASMLQTSCAMTTAQQTRPYAPQPVAEAAAPTQAAPLYNNGYPAPAGTPPYGSLPMAQAPAYYYQPQPQPDLSAEARERIERVEKAMLRLDKRMQLVERNELHRMADSDPARVSTYVTGSTEEQAAMQSLGIGPSSEGSYSNASYKDGFRPVADTQIDNTIRASVQAAPRQLASLADTSPAAGRNPQAATDVAIWTIRYEPEKVWPDRAQLPLSRDVVEALRNGKNVTLFARGPNPNAVQFRERVKAVSRYLAKVTSQDSVPIAALPTPQMEPNTIEILATH